MTIHQTASGFVELVAEWGHGKGSRPNTRQPATLTTDDGDGHYEQWKYTGKLEDALSTLASLEHAVARGEHVAIRNGNGYYVDRAPDDFWIEDEDAGEFRPNLAAYPNVIAW